MSDYTTCHTAWPETPSCTKPALVGLVASPPCSPARSNLWEPPSRTSWSRPWRFLPPPIPLPEKQCLRKLQNNIYVFEYSPQVAYQRYSDEQGLWQVSFPQLVVMLLEALWSLPRSTLFKRLMAHLIHVLWSKVPLYRLQFLLWNPNQLKEPDRAKTGAELLQLRVLYNVEWGGKEFWQNP